MTPDLPDDSPSLRLPWIITFGPLSEDEDWEPIVCGPYEQAHALALAEEIVADEELMAVVEPLAPHVSVDAIRDEIERARQAAEDEDEEDWLAAETDTEEPDDDHGEFAGPPSEQEIRAGFARIAANLTAG